MPGEKGLTSNFSGVNWIVGRFGTLVKKGSVIGEELSKTFECYHTFKSLDEGLATFSMPIYAYDGEGDPDWAWDESGNLEPGVREVCKLKADLSSLQRFLKAKKSSDGQDFWRVDFKLKVLFGGTALKARLTWYEGVSISRFHPHVTDFWLCLSENPARRPCQRYSQLSLLDHVCFLLQEDGELDPMNAFRPASVRSIQSPL